MLLNGEGLQATATTSSQLWTVSKSGANSLGVDVEGTPSVYVAVNCTTDEFDVLHAAGKTIKVRQNIPFSFYGDQYTNIKSVCYQAASDTSAVNFAAF